MNELSIYVHIPFCTSKCFYCAFCSTANNNKQESYIASLVDEITLRKHCGNVKTIYIGGGTPSVLKSGYLTQIFDCIYANFTIDANCEITVECNPESTTLDFLQECKNNKVNRISIGLQSADNNVLKLINRKHTVQDFDNAVELIKSTGFNNISADCIIGLPSENIQSIINTINHIIDLDIPHISVYSLEVVKGTKFYNDNIEVDEDAQADMYESIYNLLKEKNYNRYEVSNFAKDGYYSRHNYGYWTHRPYIGCGASAHSFIDGYRIANTNNINDYINGNRVLESNKISLDELKEEYIMLRLRLEEGLDLNLYKQIFNQDLLEFKNKEVEFLLKKGFIKIQNQHLIINDNYFYIMDSIILKLL